MYHKFPVKPLGLTDLGSPRASLLFFNCRTLAPFRVPTAKWKTPATFFEHVNQIEWDERLLALKAENLTPKGYFHWLKRCCIERMSYFQDVVHAYPPIEDRLKRSFSLTERQLVAEGYCLVIEACRHNIIQGKCYLIPRKEDHIPEVLARLTRDLRTTTTHVHLPIKAFDLIRRGCGLPHYDTYRCLTP